MVVRVPAYPPQPQQTCDRQDFAEAMAAALFSTTPSVNYEPSISRAALSAAETPVVRLPERKACLDCPHVAGRFPAILTTPDATVFDHLIEKPAHDCAAFPMVSPPKTLAGVDLGRGPHEPLTPGFEDLARVQDPTVLADALFFNRVLPACTCTKALFDAADNEGYSGVQLDFLRQEAVLKARHRPPTPPWRPRTDKTRVVAPVA